MFDARASFQAVRGPDEAYAEDHASNRTSSPGAWMPALRLTSPSDRGFQDIVPIVRVLRLGVSDDGTVY